MKQIEIPLATIYKSQLKLMTCRISCEPRFALVFGLLAFSFAAILFCIRVNAGLQLFEWGDETEKFVAAQMLSQGQHLYKDVFAHHGPVPYILAHLYAKVVSQTNFSLIRLIVALGAVVSCLSIAFSPVLKSITLRLWSAALYLSILSSVWVLQGIHMLMYGQIGGFLFVIVLSQLIIPVLLSEQPRKVGVFLSGFSLTIACFTAYSFGPAAIFFTISAILSIVASKIKNKTYNTVFLMGVITASTIVIAWLILFGDLLGYLIYHFYFNHKIYAPFIGFTPYAVLKNIIFTPSPRNFIHIISVLFFTTWILILTATVIDFNQKSKTNFLKASAIAFMCIAVLFVNPRGSHDFHNAGFVVLNFAMISLIAAWLLQMPLNEPSWQRRSLPLVLIIMIAVIVEAVSWRAISTPRKVSKKDFMLYNAVLKPKQDGIYAVIRSITNKNDRIMSLIFNPLLYINADRLPASGYYYYIPWQAAYNKASLYDYKIDICKDIVDHRPTVIWFDNIKIWNKYEVSQYGPCILNIISTGYTKYSGDNFLYIRNDLANNIAVN